MPTFRQLGLIGRVQKRRRCVVAALKGAPMRRAVVSKTGWTTPKKPNSAKRKFVKVRVLASKKLVFAHPPGIGPVYVQEYSIVMIEGGNPPDVPGINYTLIRGLYDYSIREEYGRRKKRSKYGAQYPHWLFTAPKSMKDLDVKIPKSLIPVIDEKYKLSAKTEIQR